MRIPVFNLSVMAMVKIRLLAICGLFLLAGCAGFQGDKREVLPSDFDDVFVGATEIPPGYLRMGRFIAYEDLAKIKPGTARNTVQELLGTPDRDNNGWWFYNVNLPLEDSRDYLVCQYRVTFDSSNQVSAADWRRRQCRDRFADLQQPEVQEITILSDVLFAFDSAELTAAGSDELDTVAEVVFDRVQVAQVVVVGHTDRIGAEAYNQKLSLRRAEAVRRYLVAKGVPPHLLTVEGRGASEPLVACEGVSGSASLKSCLQPNRRAQITIHGQR